jgi:hypothetical protein
MSPTTEENPGILRAFWRLITFWRLRKALGLVRAADRQFTGSVQGISDAFDLHQNKLVKQYNGLRDAIAQVESVMEQDRTRLAELNKREEQVLAMRDGALAKYEEAQRTGDQAAMARHQDAFERFDGDIQGIETEQAALEKRVKETTASMEDYLRQLTKLQNEIKALPREKAQAIADHVSAQKIVELNDRLAGLKSSVERGPIDAVLQHNRELTAKARITQKLAGTDVERQNEEYAAAGRTTTARERMQQMLAARSAERGAKTGEQPAANTEERPKI